MTRKPASISKETPLIVLLHGVGSNEGDLFSLAESFSPDALVVSLRAPLTLRAGSYAWFPVQFTPEGPVIDAAAAETSRKLLLEFLSWVRSEYGSDPVRTVLVGFSQGAIMAASVALTEPEQVRGTVLMSGRILPEVVPEAAGPLRLQKTSFLIVHGTQDDRLPIAHGRASRQTLRSLGVEAEYHELDMSHTITDESLDLVRGWVDALH